MNRKSTFAFVIVLAIAASAAALHPGTDLIVPAAARAGGSGGSVWVTDLTVFNPGIGNAAISLEWLARNQANPDPLTVSYTLHPDETLVLTDVAQSAFGLSDAAGAIRVIASAPVVANAVVLNRAGGLEYGQYVEGLPVEAALTAGGTSQAIGVTNDSDRRTNVFLVDASGHGSTATVSVLAADGSTLGSHTYTLGVAEAILRPITELGVPAFTDGTLVLSVVDGTVVAGASRVNNGTGDPVTLPFHHPLCGGVELTGGGSYHGTLYDGAGDLGGLELVVDADRMVQSVFLSFPSIKSGCSAFFAGGGAFETPFPFDDLLTGVAFTNGYQGGGEIQWTLRLTENTKNLAYGGTLTGVASSWTGSWVGCNGTLPTDVVHLGKDQP